MYDINGNPIVISSGDNWSNYLWYVVGDSLTEHNGRAATHYYDYIVDETGINIQVDGLSGTGYVMSMGSNPNFKSRVPENLANYDPDVLTIFGSGNDNHISDTELKTAIEETIDAILAVKPNLKIGLITPTPWVGYAPSVADNAMLTHSNVIIEVGKERGIPVLDLYRCSQLYPDDEAFRVEYYKEGNTQDTGVHPNSKGQERVHAQIREFLRGILTQY